MTQENKPESAQDASGEVPVFNFGLDQNDAEAQMRLNAKGLAVLGSQEGLPGIGDQAFVQADGMIMVRKGKTLVRIMYFDLSLRIGTGQTAGQRNCRRTVEAVSCEVRKWVISQTSKKGLSARTGLVPAGSAASSWKATVRGALACTLSLALCALSGCKKEDKSTRQPPQTTAANSPKPVPAPQSSQTTHKLVSLTDRNAEPTVLASPPPDMFDLKAHPDATILSAIDINKLSESERQFGIAPRRTKDVEYADGVIVMEEGDKAIRSMAGDGMHWTFDANSPHVDEFQEGKIVFATGRAVGRIVGLQRQGDSVTAFLAPVQLTDVIKKGHFAMSQKVDVANMLTYVAPDFPQPPDELVGGAKTSSNYEENDPQLERTVVVSRFHNGRWVPASVAQTYGDGRRVTYQRMGRKWSQRPMFPWRMFLCPA